MGVGNQPDVGSEPNPIPAPIVVSDITINSNNGTNFDLVDGGIQTANLSVDVLPVDADDKKVTYAVTEGSAVKVTPANGLVTALEIGEAIVTATAADGSGIIETITFTVVDTTV